MTKILIIRLSSFGDIVLTTPLLRCLKNQIPQQLPSKNVEIHYLVKKKFYPVIQANPHITKFHIIEERISEIIPDLKKENFDYVLDLHNNFRSILVKSMLQKPCSTLDKLNVRKWLLVNFKINKLPDVHIVDRYLETAKSLGVKNDGLGLDHYIPPQDEVEISSLPPAFQKGYIAFVIGGNFETKKLPVEKLIAICKNISKPLILLGGMEDMENGQKISAQIDHTPLFNACGKFNINQSASLIRQAGKVISHDTGLMHIAAAFKKEIISVWGNTVPEFGMYPYYGNLQVKNHHAIIPDLSCRPCSKLGFKSCPKKHFKCMNLQDEVDIAKRACE